MERERETKKEIEREMERERETKKEIEREIERAREIKRECQVAEVYVRAENPY